MSKHNFKNLSSKDLLDWRKVFLQRDAVQVFSDRFDDDFSEVVENSGLLQYILYFSISKRFLDD